MVVVGRGQGPPGQNVASEGRTPVGNLSHQAWRRTAQNSNFLAGECRSSHAHARPPSDIRPANRTISSGQLFAGHAQYQWSPENIFVRHARQTPTEPKPRQRPGECPLKSCMPNRRPDYQCAAPARMPPQTRYSAVTTPAIPPRHSPNVRQVNALPRQRPRHALC